ncbi:MAG: HDOD domain-containing protein [Aestuariibacter sp.]
MSTENALLTILVEKINNDTLVLPTLPAIALKVRKAADDPEVNLNSMADVIALDPSLSARIIKISNSAYLGRAVKVENINQAVTRIGLTQIKNIATALAMEQLFVSKNKVVKGYINKIWDRTIEVVANALALHQFYVKDTKDKRLNVDSMTLAGLMHNIGVLPILTEAERHEEVFANPAFLNASVQKMSGRIGGAITREWGFGEEFVIVAESWRNLKVQTEQVSYLDFIRLASAIAGFINSQKDAIMNLSMQKNMMSDYGIIDTDEYNDAKEAAKLVFK